MVTVILLFIFVAPLFHPLQRQTGGANPASDRRRRHSRGNSRLVCRVEASAVQEGNEAEIRHSLIGVIEPIVGEVKFIRYEAVRDSKGKIIAYNVWVQRGLGG